MKYHIAASGKNSGQYVPCTAEYKCRLGGDESHMFFENIEEVDEYNQLLNASLYGSVGGDFSERDKERKEKLENLSDQRREVYKVQKIRERYPDMSEPATVENVILFLDKAGLWPGWGEASEQDDEIAVMVEGPNKAGVRFTVEKDSSMEEVYEATVDYLSVFDADDEFFRLEEEGVLIYYDITEEELFNNILEDKKFIDKQLDDTKVLVEDIRSKYRQGAEAMIDQMYKEPLRSNKAQQMFQWWEDLEDKDEASIAIKNGAKDADVFVQEFLKEKTPEEAVGELLNEKLNKEELYNEEEMNSIDTVGYDFGYFMQLMEYRNNIEGEKLRGRLEQ